MTLSDFAMNMAISVAGVGIIALSILVAVAILKCACLVFDWLISAGN